MTSTTGGGMGTQESSSEGVPRRGADIGGDNSTAKSLAGDDSQSSESQSSESQPSDSQPSESQPTGSQPSESHPTQSQVGESQPTRAQPVDGLPAGETSDLPAGETSDPAAEPQQDSQHTSPQHQNEKHTSPQHQNQQHTSPQHAGQPPGGSDQSFSEGAGSPRQDGRPIEAHFANPRRQRPQRYNRGRSKVHPTTPLDPITPYMAGPVPRRRKSDWPILVFALIVAAVVMAACCVAGFAIFRTYGLSF